LELTRTLDRINEMPDRIHNYTKTIVQLIQILYHDSMIPGAVQNREETIARLREHYSARDDIALLI
jgi:hypothetical protein